MASANIQDFTKTVPNIHLHFYCICFKMSTSEHLNSTVDDELVGPVLVATTTVHGRRQRPRGWRAASIAELRPASSVLLVTNTLGSTSTRRGYGLALAHLYPYCATHHSFKKMNEIFIRLSVSSAKLVDIWVELSASYSVRFLKIKWRLSLP